MDFPADPPRRVEAPAGVAEALGATPAEVWLARYLVAVFETEDEVRALAPDIAALGRPDGPAAEGHGNLGVAALANSGAGYDVVSRFFAPGSGISEDPATGSLHCILAPLFFTKLGRDEVRFHQAFPGRGGDITCTRASERVRLAGRAVTVLDGRLRV
jgi:predicted PhzF superfamily epimerase YddE/YHI9